MPKKGNKEIEPVAVGNLNSAGIRNGTTLGTGFPDAERLDRALAKGTGLSSEVYHGEGDGAGIAKTIPLKDGNTHVRDIYGIFDEITVKTSIHKPTGKDGWYTQESVQSLTVHKAGKVVDALVDAVDRAFSDGTLSAHEALQLEKLRQVIAASAVDDSKFDKGEIRAIVKRAAAIAPEGMTRS